MEATTVSGDSIASIHVDCSGWVYRPWRWAAQSTFVNYFNNDIHGHAIEDVRTLKSMAWQIRR